MNYAVFKTENSTIHLIHSCPDEAEKLLKKYGNHPGFTGFFTGKSIKYKLQQALKIELSEQLNLSRLLSYLPDGKPVLADGRYISISHTGFNVGIALSEKTPVGLDIQIPGNKVMRILDKFASDQEKKSIDSLEKAVFLWTAKEAVYKAAGIRGLSFKSIRIMFENGLPATATVFRENLKTRYVLTSKNTGGLAMVLAEKS